MFISFCGCFQFVNLRIWRVLSSICLCDCSRADRCWFAVLLHPMDCLGGKKNQACFNMSFPNCSGWTHSAPMDTHDSVTKTTPQLMVLRHGALSGFCSISILMKGLNAFLDWMKSRGGSSKGWEDHKPSVCGPSELWSLRCCLVPVPLASSVATVSLTNCLPKWVNGLLRCSGNTLSSQRCFLNHCLYGCLGSIKRGRGCIFEDRPVCWA